ncbi:hypothetical protein RHAB21_02535 [Pseudorhizobium halotolerans]|uniref:DUF6161 domain-containing protein n=1 Tax=Pseudorhizobium halotolerans TaxID=1233081 RepID=A0ABN7JLE0_9HYPH|nr:DUF6161 domain-containing protein [Pseudorhizobium halotolerans]CAD7036523.1 hypothetical protein RHAB21_02535 [Pseudorhizobium halotolerans]
MFAVSDSDIRLMQMVFSNRAYDLAHAENKQRTGGKLINEQRALHARIAQIAARIANMTLRPSITNRAAASFKNFTEQVASMASHSIEEEEQATVVKGNVPVLDDADIDKLDERLSSGTIPLLAEPLYAEEALASLMVTYREAFRVRDADLDMSNLGSFSNEFNKALARITWLNFRDAEIDQISVLEGSFRSRLTDYDTLASRNSASVVEMRRGIDGLEEQLNGLGSQVERTKSEFSDIDSRIKATEAAFFERVGTKETEKLWQREARKAYWSFFVSGAFLMAVLISVPLFVICYREELLSFLQSIERGAIQLSGNDRPAAAAALIFGRLLLLTVPVGSLVWAIKLLVRFNVRSMLLMDDANQRVTMLNTYLFLVSQRAASQEDRGALLEAMFRRAPGHGPETIEPPNMVDILNYGKHVGKPAAG